MRRWILFGAATAVLALLAAALAWPRVPAAPADRPLGPLTGQKTGEETGRAPLTVVAFGTSLTASNPWPEALQARLSDCLGRPVAVTRVARNGAGTSWAESNLAAVIAAVPDLVLLEFVTNDADIADGRGLAASRAAHARLLDGLAAERPAAQVMLLTMNPVFGPVRHLQRPFLARYDAMLRELAVERGVALADLAPRWQAAVAADPGLAPPDGLHPTGAATARVTVPALAALIAPAAGGPGC